MPLLLTRKSLYDSYTNGAFYSVLTRFLTGVRVKSQNHHNFPSLALTIDRSHNLKSEEVLLMKNINLTQTSAWQALQKLFDEMKDVTISELFAKDSDRFS
ncbi:hypothetical protein LNQ03_15705 [Klebsiella pneumoniae subsp. pneumoniae]|nr:hypothetical protein [Klebsiella pneumoniae subsp. pneumoniae]